MCHSVFLLTLVSSFLDFFNPIFFLNPACECSSTGSSSAPCDKSTGKCTCLPNFRGAKCDQCVAGYYGYPACLPCRCDPVGSFGTSCRSTNGQCSCRSQFQGRQCNKCQPGFYGFPDCQKCQCNPAGTKSGPGGIDCSSTSNVSVIRNGVFQKQSYSRNFLE